jgi:hypothetical protein
MTAAFMMQESVNPFITIHMSKHTINTDKYYQYITADPFS